jgi:hypothetical protein
MATTGRDLGLGRRAMLEWHLTSNHFPPVPLVWVDTCLEVIDAVAAREAAPEDIVNTPAGFPDMPVYKVVQGLHLQAFIEAAEQ